MVYHGGASEVHSTRYIIERIGNTLHLKAPGRRCGALSVARSGELVTVRYDGKSVKLAPIDSATALSLASGVSDLAAEFRKMHLHVPDDQASVHPEYYEPSCVQSNAQDTQSYAVWDGTSMIVLRLGPNSGTYTLTHPGADGKLVDETYPLRITRHGSHLLLSIQDASKCCLLQADIRGSELALVLKRRRIRVGKADEAQIQTMRSALSTQSRELGRVQWLRW